MIGLYSLSYGLRGYITCMGEYDRSLYYLQRCDLLLVLIQMGGIAFDQAFFLPVKRIVKESFEIICSYLVPIKGMSIFVHGKYI